MVVQKIIHFKNPRMSGKKIIPCKQWTIVKDLQFHQYKTIGTDFSTDTATLSITLDGSGLILIALTTGFSSGTTTYIFNVQFEINICIYQLVIIHDNKFSI